MTRALRIVALVSMASWGCGEGTPADALPIRGVTFLPACSGDNDGEIAAGELHFTPGVTAPYAVQRADDTPVQAKGDAAAGEAVWDFSQTRFEGLEEVETLSPASFWYADRVPEANLALPLAARGGDGADVPSHLILRATAERVQIVGVASEAEGRQFLRYTTPAPFMQFPMALGDAYSATVTLDGEVLFDGAALSPEVLAGATDAYTIDVGGRGTLRLPGMSIDNVLALSLRLDRHVIDPLSGPRTTTSEQTYLIHECLGTVAVRAGEAGPWRVIWYPR